MKEKKKKFPYNTFRKSVVAGILGLTLGFTAFGLAGCSNGVDGKDGTQWYSGIATPQDSQGVNGDFYLDTDDYILYQKVNGIWVAKMNDFGRDGTDGAKWLTGSEVPESDQGEIGDLYLDVLTGIAYKKDASGWLKIANLQADVANTFYVYTAEQLWDILKNAVNYQGCTIKLKNDLDFADIEHDSLNIDARGWSNKTLCIDGGGNTIKNFTSENKTVETVSRLYADAFVSVIYGFSKFTIKNLTLDNMSISATFNDQTDIAGFFGNIGNSQVELNNCKIINSALSGKRVGGLIGYTEPNSISTIIDCVVENNILTSKSSSGGLISMNYAKVIVLSEYESNRCRVIGNTFKGIESDTDLSCCVSRVVSGATAEIGSSEKNIYINNNQYLIYDASSEECVSLEGYTELGRCLVGGTLTFNGETITTTVLGE